MDNNKINAIKRAIENTGWNVRPDSIDNHIEYHHFCICESLRCERDDLDLLGHCAAVYRDYIPVILTKITRFGGSGGKFWALCVRDERIFWGACELFRSVAARRFADAVSSPWVAPRRLCYDDACRLRYRLTREGLSNNEIRAYLLGIRAGALDFADNRNNPQTINPN